MNLNDDDETNEMLVATAIICVATFIFIIVLFDNALDRYIEVHGREYRTLRGPFGGEYQRPIKVGIFDLEFGTVLSSVIIPSIAFFIGYAVIGRISLYLINAVGFAFTSITGKRRESLLVVGYREYIRAAAWPVFAFYITFCILAIIFVSIFKLVFR